MKTLLKRLGIAASILGMGFLPSTQISSLTQTAADENNSTKLDPSKAQVQVAYGNLPLYFIQNDGQVDKQVKFYEKGSGHATYFTKDGIHLSLAEAPRETLNSALTISGAKGGVEGLRQRSEGRNPKAAMVRLVSLGANENPKIVAEGLQEGKVNYFIGKDPKKWRTNIPTYQKVIYKEIYPGIDMKFYGNNHQLEYDIIIKPGADSSRVRLAYEGIEGLDLAKEGNLVIALKEGKILQKKPHIYQEIDGKRVDVAGEFKVDGSTHKTQDSKQFAYSFDVASYNKNYPLIIDPTLVYSTYLGGTSNDGGSDIAVDTSGNVYVLGTTWSTNFPTTPGALQTSLAGYPYDAFIVKLNASGSAIIYSTYLGGSNADLATSIKLDSSGNAYVAGQTLSTDFPTTPGSLQTTPPGGIWDVFIAKLNTSGSGLVYSTYLGGSGDDDTYTSSMTLDTSGNVYLTGRTGSLNFPTTPGALQTTVPASFGSAFVSKLNPSGSALVYSTYLGGSGTYGEYGYAIGVDTSGNAYVAGGTYSTDFPTTPGAFQTVHAGGVWDAFIVKLNPSGSALIYSTYLGGSGEDLVYGGISVDTSGNAYVIGGTASTDFPTTPGVLQTALAGDIDAFITKLNASGSALIYSTYLGGSGREFVGVLTTDASGNAYLKGSTNSTDFPTTLGALQTTYGGGVRDLFIAKLNTSGSGLVYSTYLGGSGEDFGGNIVVDTSGNAYVAGVTGSTNFPTVNPFQANYGGGDYDAFVVKIADATPTELINISTRGFVQTGDNVMIGGFIIGAGTGNKTVLIRSRGPSLVENGVSGAISNPYVELYSGQTKIAQNDNWQTTDPLCGSPAISCGNAQDIQATGKDPCSIATTGCTLESAILITLPPGPYTAIVRGVGGGTGVGNVGVFDVDSSTLTKMVNISSRGLVLTGDSVMIGGFILGGNVPKTVLIRSRGPSLVENGVSGAISNPYVELYSGQTKIAQNDDWQTTDPLCGSPAVSCGNATDIQNTGKDPCSIATTGCTLESAIYITLPPGPYTAIVRGVGGATGVGNVGIFDLGP